MIIERIVVPAQYNVVSSAKIDLLEFNLMKQKSLKKIINKNDTTYSNNLLKKYRNAALLKDAK